jgi:hypothetical protein
MLKSGIKSLPVHLATVKSDPNNFRDHYASVIPALNFVF